MQTVKVTRILFAALAASQALCGLFGYLVVKSMLKTLDALRGVLGGENDG